MTKSGLPLPCLPISTLPIHIGSCSYEAQELLDQERTATSLPPNLHSSHPYWFLQLRGPRALGPRADCHFPASQSPLFPSILVPAATRPKSSWTLSLLRTARSSPPLARSASCP